MQAFASVHHRLFAASLTKKMYPPEGECPHGLLRQEGCFVLAQVSIDNGVLNVNLSLLDRMLAFHGSFHIPLSHITNAFVSDFEDLELQYKLEGTNWGIVKSAGVFANPQGLIFCDVGGEANCLVIETRGERFARIAVQLPAGQDANALAHQIMQAIPDSGPVD